ncbi:MAG TPA: ketose-bisphosphate aldolase [Gaiellaceae bacterium]|nr:ketose-bisphosphate aldolase [Gaiellaceae bacterium]
MPLVSMRQLLDQAAAGGYALGAFNVANLEQVQAVMEAAERTQSPVILQATPGARRYANDRFLVHLVRAATEVYPGIPVVLHLDHGNSPETCFSAIEQGFTSVMMDGSLREDGKTPTDFDENVAVTRTVVDHAHAVGVTVEGELGTIGGIEDGHGSGRARLTDPDEAVEFVARTGVDALAVAIGTSHGAYKFSQPPTGALLAMDVLEQIHERLPATHLVLHGSSSMPQALVERINAFGGALRPTWGVPVDEIERGIRHGVRKVNVETDARLAATGALRQFFSDRPGEIDPRTYLGAARDAMRAVYEERMTQFGQAGHAGDVEPRSLAEMAALYARS